MNESSIDPMKVTEQLTYSTIRVECFVEDLVTKERKLVGRGSSFLFRIDLDDSRQTEIVVTNKHVIEGATHARLCFTRAGEDKKPIVGNNVWLDVLCGPGTWIEHPNPDVDLCAFVVSPVVNAYASSGNPVFTMSIPEAMIPDFENLDELDTVSDVLMIGYPTGLWDSANNKPIVRQGITATHPKHRYEGRDEFVLDIAAFPGSSGSPVFTYVNTFTQEESGYGLGKQLGYFLGILYAGPQHHIDGDIDIVDVPMKTIPIARMKIPTNLGFVIRSSELLQLKKEVILWVDKMGRKYADQQTPSSTTS